MKILNPVSAPAGAGPTARPVVPSLEGMRVGILTNHWRSMDRMAQRMRLELQRKHRTLSVTTYDIPINGAMTATTERAVLEECDAAIIGLAN
jgi:hypothetical protein